VSRRHFAGPV